MNREWKLIGVEYKKYAKVRRFLNREYIEDETVIAKGNERPEPSELEKRKFDEVYWTRRD